MITTFPEQAASSIVLPARWVARALTWGLMLGMISFIVWSYLASPQPSPYGQCYVGRGRPMPCKLVKQH